MQKHHKFFVLFSLVLYWLSFSSVLFAATLESPMISPVITVPGDQVGQYQAYLELGGGRLFNQESTAATIYDLFIPVYQQRNNQVIFTDLRIFDRSGSAFENNIHLGYRKIYPDKKIILGVYGAFDRKISGRRNIFNQLAFGFEFWKNSLFIGGNFYQPIGETKKNIGMVTPEELVVTGRNIIGINMVESQEKALAGIDGELGYMVTENLIGYFGGYYFKARDTNTLAGPKLRLVYDYSKPQGRILGLFDGMGVEAGGQHDIPRGYTGYVGLRLKIGLMNINKNSNVAGFEQHLVELVKRDPDIMLRSVKTSRFNEKSVYRY